MTRYQHQATIVDYNPKRWPVITGIFGQTSDLVDGMSVIGRSHTNTVDETERWAKNRARIDHKPIRWRVFTNQGIVACGIEYPPQESKP